MDDSHPEVGLAEPVGGAAPVQGAAAGADRGQAVKRLVRPEGSGGPGEDPRGAVLVGAPGHRVDGDTRDDRAALVVAQLVVLDREIVLV